MYAGNLNKKRFRFSRYFCGLFVVKYLIVCIMFTQFLLSNRWQQECVGLLTFTVLTEYSQISLPNIYYKLIVLNLHLWIRKWSLDGLKCIYYSLSLLCQSQLSQSSNSTDDSYEHLPGFRSCRLRSSGGWRGRGGEYFQQHR